MHSFVNSNQSFVITCVSDLTYFLLRWLINISFHIHIYMTYIMAELHT